MFLNAERLFPNKTPQTLVITMPYSPYIRNIDTNAYKCWLEQQTGLQLTFNIIPESYSVDDLERFMASGNVKTDIWLSFNPQGDFLSNHALMAAYGEKGYILPLNPYITPDTNMSRILNAFHLYDLNTVIAATDGNLYYVPALDVSDNRQTAQVFWMNINWLKNLKMTIPQTTEELHQVLTAFKHNDPNRNGVADEIPLAGAMNDTSLQSYHFIINAFIYNDPRNSCMYMDKGTVQFAPVTQQWRQAMQYLHVLYEEGLLHPLQFELDNAQLSELANSPENILGGFTANNITHVLNQNTPEVMSNFIYLAPLKGPDGVQLSTVQTPLPTIGGIITSACESPEDAFKLLDLMLSEEAYLMSWYGEKGVDWEYAASTDIDAYGYPAKIKVKNSLTNKMQNKHLAQIGPFYTYTAYANSMTWSGFEADPSYVNARAYRIYETYRPKPPQQHLSMIMFNGSNREAMQALRQEVDAYTGQSIQSFIIGAKDPYDDGDWNDHVARYEALGIDDLVEAAQQSYDLLLSQN